MCTYLHLHEKKNLLNGIACHQKWILYDNGGQSTQWLVVPNYMLKSNK